MGIRMNIEQLIKRYDRIFLDASTLLSQSGQDLLSSLLKMDIQDFGGANHIIITKESVDQIKQHPGVTKARYLLQSLKNLHDRKLVQLRFFDHASYAQIFSKFIGRYSLGLFIQDKDQAEEILSLIDYSESRAGVYYLTKKNQIIPFNEKVVPSTSASKRMSEHDSAKQDQAPAQEDINSHTTSVPNDAPLSKNPFSKKFIEHPVVFKGIEKHDKKLNHIIPGVNDRLLSSNQKPVTLVSVVSEKGGEGIIYHTNIKGYVAKIYRPNSLTKHKYEKLQLLVSKPLQDSRIAYPSELLFFQGKFVGYLMPFVKGNYVGNFFAGLISVKQFPNWTRSDLVELSINILKIVRKMHSHGILIGDVNRNNFMVESPKRVYAVDVDSAQVEKYPCPVGVEEFTPPEIIDGKNSYKEFFRTFKNEYYSIAVLIFMLLNLGAQTTTKIQNGRTSSESLSKIEKIKRQSFGFTLNERETISQQNTINYALWSKLPSYLKEAFYHTFHHSGRYNHPDARLSIDKWLELLLSYKFQLADGTIGQRDPDYNELITKNAVPYKKMNLEPIRMKEISIKALSFASLKESLPKTHPFIKSNDIPEIIQQLESTGRAKLPSLKLSLVKNYGFMYQFQGTAIVSGGA